MVLLSGIILFVIIFLFIKLFFKFLVRYVILFIVGVVYMLYLVLIIIIIFLCKKNYDKDVEIQKLKQKNDNIIKFCPECGHNLYNNDVSNDNYYEKSDQINGSKTVENVGSYNDYNKDVDYKEPKYTDKEIKNSLILIVGSVLIILSAILFLTTTWNFTHNIFKTLIMVLMLIVFFAASFIADKILNLKTTSKAFYYIGLAYLPIVFFSISLFSLFGRYFSIYGLGKYIYLTVSSIVTTYIYYHNAKIKNSKLLSVSTMIFSIISIILFTLIFTTSSIIIISLLAVYLLILSVLYVYKKYILYMELHLKSITTLLFSLIILTIYYNVYNIMIANVMPQDILLDILIFCNFYVYTNFVVNEEKLYQYSYPILIILIFYHFSKLFSMFFVNQLLFIISFILLYVYDLIKKNSVQAQTFFTILISGIILYLTTIFNSINLSYCMSSYIILLVLCFLSLIHYFYKINEYKYPAYCFNIFIILSILDFLISNSLSLVFFGYSVLFMLCISLMFKFNKIFNNSLLVVCNISFILISLVNYDNSIFLVMLYILYSIINFILYHKEKIVVYKIISYIYVNVSLILLIILKNTNNTNLLFYIVPATTIMFIIMERLIKSLNDDNNHYYIFVQLIISLILLNFLEVSIFNFILLLLIDGLYLFYVNKNKWDKNYLYIFYVALIPYMYIKNFSIFHNFNLMYFVSIGMLSIFSYLIYEKKEKMFIILFSIFTFFHIKSFNDSKYICLLIISIGTFASYLIYSEKIKDLLKAFLYIYILIFFRFIMFDFALENITFLHYGIYLVWVPIITRTIIKKYDIDYKTWEYISYIAINVLSIYNYSSEMDGIMFVFLLTILVILGYILKFGPIFIVSLISILINVLLLTRTFWLSIPWWLYILLIGSILISFSIYNEINIKKNKESIVNKIITKFNL